MSIRQRSNVIDHEALVIVIRQRHFTLANGVDLMQVRPDGRHPHTLLLPVEKAALIVFEQ